MLITESRDPKPILSDLYNKVFGSGDIGPIPGLIVWMIIVVVIGAIVLAKTRFGRQVLATRAVTLLRRSSPASTPLRSPSGSCSSPRCWPPWRGCSTRGSYSPAAISGVPAMSSGRVAAVILGGTSLFGGSGTVVGTLFGALLIGLINNGLILAGLDTSQQQVVRGVIIILAVALARRK